MTRLATLCLVLAIGCATAQPVAAVQSIAGQATVIDGDTIEIHSQKIRLLDMDAPESRQFCTDGTGVRYHCGQKAAFALADLVGRHTVTCYLLKKDRYRRWLGRCVVAGLDLGEWMVREGWAVPYRDCKCETYRDAAFAAKGEALGIWAGEFMLPWDWRKANR